MWIYTDNERQDLKQEFQENITKLNLIKDKQSKEYKELNERTTTLYEIINDL